MNDLGTGGHPPWSAIFMPALDRPGIDRLHWITGRQGRQTEPEARHACERLHFQPAYVFICCGLPRWSIHSPWVVLVDVLSGMGREKNSDATFLDSISKQRTAACSHWVVTGT